MSLKAMSDRSRMCKKHEYTRKQQSTHSEPNSYSQNTTYKCKKHNSQTHKRVCKIQNVFTFDIVESAFAKHHVCVYHFGFVWICVY